MNVDIYVQYAIKAFTQFENCEHDIIDVAEAGRLIALGVMSTAVPVDGNVGRVILNVLFVLFCCFVLFVCFVVFQTKRLKKVVSSLKQNNN